MQNEASQVIVKRFFDAILELKKRKIIRGKQTFIGRYEINKRNFWQLEQNLAKDIMQLSWLSHIVEDFGISAKWLLTGKGKMFESPKQKKENDDKPHNTVRAGQGKKQAGRKTEASGKVERE